MSDEIVEVAPEVIKEAESQGWVPREKFRGSDEEWVDADTFVKRGREIMPILRKNNQTLLSQLEQTKSQLEEFKQAAEEFKQFQKDAREKETKELKQQISALKAARAQAISDGDGDRVSQIEDAIEGLQEQGKAAKEEPVEPPKVPEAQPLDPVLQNWVNNNSWFGKDRKLTEYTTAAGEELREQYPNLVGEAFLEKLDEVLREEFPKKFGKPEKPESPVESGAGRNKPSGSNKKSYANLPDDAKAACDKYIKQGLIKSKEEYVEMYDWS